MGKRQREWARLQTLSLRAELGGVCVRCGTSEKLEFDLKIPFGDNKHHRRMDWSHRLSFYRRENWKGNLQLLCQKCNAKKGNQMELVDLKEIPF